MHSFIVLLNKNISPYLNRFLALFITLFALHFTKIAIIYKALLDCLLNDEDRLDTGTRLESERKTKNKDFFSLSLNHSIENYTQDTLAEKPDWYEITMTREKNINFYKIYPDIKTTLCRNQLCV